jgi:polyadenylate-binding protein
MPSPLQQSGPRPALPHLAPTGSECPDRLAMDFDGAGAAQQGLTDSCQSGGVPTAVSNLAPPAPRAVAPYKYTSSVHRPHPAIQPLQAPQPAVHVQVQEPLTASMLAAASLPPHPRPHTHPRSRSRCWGSVCPC